MPSLSPVLLRPFVFSAAIGMPLFGHAAGKDPGVQGGISVGATSGAYTHYGAKPLVVPAIAWRGQRFFASPGSLGMYLYKGRCSTNTASAMRKHCARDSPPTARAAPRHRACRSRSAHHWAPDGARPASLPANGSAMQ